jgi:DTW domain-containing protein YfiP
MLSSPPPPAEVPFGPAAPRVVCYRCDKPERMCVCARISRVDNLTRVFVLQHPKERAHPIGTARFAKLGLANSQVEVAWDAGAEETEPPSWLPPGAALLYPSASAADLETMAPSELPKNLVVIDGTWHTARSLFRDKSWLQRLPQVRLSPASPSRYRIRREPREDFVSTLEAIVQALQVIEPATQGFDALLGAFDSMIDDQLAHIARATGSRHDRKRRPLPQRRTPRALVEAFDRLVVAYVESYRDGEVGPRDLIHVALVSMRTGATFERIARPSAGMPKPALLRHMRLTERDFDDAADQQQLAREIAAFLSQRCGQSPLLAAWNQSSLDLIAAALGQKPSRLSLKSAYRSVYGADSKELHEAVEARGLNVQANAFRGRASSRIANALAIGQHLHERALGKLEEER